MNHGYLFFAAGVLLMVLLNVAIGRPLSTTELVVAAFLCGGNLGIWAEKNRGDRKADDHESRSPDGDGQSSVERVVSSEGQAHGTPVSPQARRRDDPKDKRKSHDLSDSREI